MTSNRWAMTGESATRRVFGLALGALLGLVYGLTSQTINRIILPGIPLYQPPLGPAGNTLLIALLGALLGMVAAWPTGSIAGTFAASTVAAGLLTFVSFLSVRLTEKNTSGMIVAALFVLLPLIGLMVPLLGLVPLGCEQGDGSSPRGRLHLEASPRTVGADRRTSR